MRVSSNTVLRTGVILLVGAYVMYFWVRLQSSKRPVEFSLHEESKAEEVTRSTMETAHETSHTVLRFKAHSFKLLEDRRLRLQSMCRRNEFKSFRVPQNLIVDRTRKLMYCEVPKIGSTFWKSVFAILSGNFTNVRSPSKLMRDHWREIHARQFLRFSHLTPQQQKAMTTMGRFLLFTRDPYMRLLSAYLDKFVRPNKHYWQGYGTMVVNKLRYVNSSSNRQCGHDVSFEEFVDFFIGAQTTDNVFYNTDDHWTPIHRLCSPCSYPYYYIGKTESMFEDTKSIVQSEKLSGVMDLVFSRNVTQTVVEDISRRAEQFVTEYTKVSDCISLREVATRFWRYLSAKGYFEPRTPLPKQLAYTKHLSKEGFRISSLLAVKEFNKQYTIGSLDLNRRKFAEIAYSTIPVVKLNSLKKILKTDCILFGYDIEPNYVFRNLSSSFPEEDKEGEVFY